MVTVNSHDDWKGVVRIFLKENVVKQFGVVQRISVVGDSMINLLRG